VGASNQRAEIYECPTRTHPRPHTVLAAAAASRKVSSVVLPSREALSLSRTKHTARAGPAMVSQRAAPLPHALGRAAAAAPGGHPGDRAVRRQAPRDRASASRARQASGRPPAPPPRPGSEAGRRAGPALTRKGREAMYALSAHSLCTRASARAKLPTSSPSPGASRLARSTHTLARPARAPLSAGRAGSGAALEQAHASDGQAGEGDAHPEVRGAGQLSAGPASTTSVSGERCIGARARPGGRGAMRRLATRGLTGWPVVQGEGQLKYPPMMPRHCAYTPECGAALPCGGQRRALLGDTAAPPHAPKR
jgi:hypothetical protein